MKKIKEKMLAPIEQIFGNHCYCGSWCYALKAVKEGKQYLPDNSLPMYDKKLDIKTYHQLTEAVRTFTTDEIIKETLHDFDTQQNEALNMAVSRYVPKFKHYGTTCALDTRVRCVIGSHNMGYKDFYLSLLINLGCLNDTSIETTLISTGISRINETRKQNKRIKALPDVKRRRQHGLLAKTKQQIYEERVDRASKMGTYKTGIAIDFDVTENKKENTRQSSNASKQKQCPRCGKKGHVTTRSKKCLHHNEYITMKKNQMISLPQTEIQTNNNISLTTGNTIENEKN